MATIFISDLHLGDSGQPQALLFQKFLRKIAGSAEALYILGDLFEVWVGDDVSPQFYEGTIHALRELAQARTPVYVMHGNRDFLLGEQFARLTGCQLIPDPMLVNLYGTRTVLCHGDTLCTDDVEYQKFRAEVRSGTWQQRFLALAPEQRLATARNYREESARRTKEKPEYITDVNQTAVDELMRRHQVTRLIHGHTHRPGMHAFTLDGTTATRYVLGDWSDEAKVLFCDADSCWPKTIR